MINTINNLAHPWSNEVEQSKTLPLFRNSYFYYMHHPKNWELIYFPSDKSKSKKPMLIPCFSILNCTAGINNVRVRSSATDTNLAVTNLREQGFTILDPSKHDYLRVFPARNGKYHADKFTSFEAIGESVIQEYDKNSFNEWKRQLMIQQVLKVPHKHFVRFMLVDNQREIDKYTKNQHIPQLKHKLDVVTQYAQDVRLFMKKVEKMGSKAYE